VILESGLFHFFALYADFFRIMQNVNSGSDTAQILKMLKIDTNHPDYKT